jgi:hypothetical protein
LSFPLSSRASLASRLLARASGSRGFRRLPEFNGLCVRAVATGYSFLITILLTLACACGVFLSETVSTPFLKEALQLSWSTSHCRPTCWPTCSRTLQRLGGLAGSVLDTLAQSADQHPPTLATAAAPASTPSASSSTPPMWRWNAWPSAELRPGGDVAPRGVLGWPQPMPPAAKYALTYLFVQAEFGLCCPLSMTDSLTRTLRKFGARRW